MQETLNPYAAPSMTPEDLAAIRRIDEFRALVFNRSAEALCAFGAVGGTAYAATHSYPYAFAAGIGGAVVSIVSK